MGLKFTNNSEGTLSAGISAIVTSLALQSGEGLQFPIVVAGSGDYFYVTIVNVAGVREVVKVTEHQSGTDTFQTIVRAADAIQNGTPTAYAWLANDRVQGRLPAAAILAPTGTDNTDFHIDQDNTGPRIKNVAGVLEIRNATDAAYANMKALGLELTAALVIAGSVTGATSGAFSAGVTVGTTLEVTGAITGSATSSIPLDNEATSDKIKCRDHGTITDPEAVNVVYGTGAAPAANTTPIGTLYIKYIA